MQKQLLIESIKTDGGTQSRKAINEETVTEYAEAIQAGAKLPAILVFFDGTTYWAADGFHRILAHIKAGIPNILADVERGAQPAAIWASIGSNLSHGVRRTNADRQNVVEMALKIRPDLSDEALGQHCGVSYKTIQRARGKDHQGVTLSPPATRTGVDGKTYTLPPVPTPPAHERAPMPHSAPAVPGQATTPPMLPMPKAPPPGPRATPENGKVLAVPAGWTVCVACGGTGGATKGGTCTPCFGRGLLPPVGTTTVIPLPPTTPGPAKGQLDETGHPIPDHLLEFWERRSEFDVLMKTVSMVKCEIEHAKEASDPLFGELSTGSVIAHQQSVYGELAAAKPYAVCPWCHGALSDQCRGCQGRGFIGKLHWDYTVPTNLKVGREKKK